MDHCKVVKRIDVRAWCRYEKNLGTLLAPPLDQNHKLGPLVPTLVIVQGPNWKQSSMDIAVAGLGWVAVGVSGEAEFTVWAHEGALASYSFFQCGTREQNVVLHVLGSKNAAVAHAVIWSLTGSVMHLHELGERLRRCSNHHPHCCPARLCEGVGEAWVWQ